MKLFVYYLVAALLVLGTNGQVTWTCPTNSQPVTLANSYMVTIPTNISNSIPILFREGSTPHPSLVSLQTPTSIKLTAPSNISITFITQTSNFRNQLGYFIFNENTQNVDDSTPLSALPLIWPDVTRSGLSVTPKGCMTAGLTTRIGPFAAGTRIGFFMRQDGYLDANNYKLNNTIWWSINSTNLVNLDGYRHTSIVSIDGKIIVGFEDFTGMGDQDYNDVLFYATVEGGWDGTGIPVYNGEVVDTCLTGKVVKTRNYNCRSYGLLGTSNFQGCLGYISIPAGWSIADQSESTRLVITNTKNFNWDRYTGQNICMMTSNGNGVYQNGTDCTPMPIKYLSTNNRCVYVPCDRGILLAGPNVTNCQQTLSKCNVTNNNVIIGQTPATKANTSIVYPNTYSVLVSTVVNSKLPLNFDVWVPTKPNVDVFVAIDLNGLSAATLDNIRTQLSSFYTQASNLWNVKLGFGTFWTNGTTLGVNSHLFLTNNAATISSVAASFTPPNNLVPGPTSRVVEAYRYFAGNSTIGWRRSACFGVVVVLTGRPMFNYTARLMADMASWNNVPVFFSNVNATTYNIYQNFINNLPIGYNGALTDTYQNWPSMAMDVLNNYTVRVQFDPYYTSTPSWNELYWVRSDMPPVLYNPPLGAWTTRAAPLTYPGTYPVNDFGVIEIFTVNMICWGYRSMGVAVNLNNPPRVSNLIFSFNEDESFDFDLYGRVSDPENNALTVQLLSLPGANGVLTYQDATVISVGTIYDQSSLLFNIKSIPANWNGQLNMTYQANDGCVNSTVGTITFNVLPVNDPPTNEDFSSTTKEDTSVLLDFSTHIADIDDLNSTLRIYIQSLPNFGTLKDGSTVVTAGSTLTGQTVTFVPAANFNGIVTFTYKAVDPSNAKSLSASTVTVTVTAVPDPPTSTNIEVTTKMNAPVSFRLSGTSLDGNPISVILQTLPGKGTLTNNGASLSATPVNVGLTTAHNLTFTPPVNQFAVPMTTFLFKVNDGLDSVSSYTVTINVVSDGALINLPPTGADTSLTTPEDTDLLVNVTSLLSDGEDPIWNLTVTIETLPSFGTLRNGATQLVKGSVLPAKAVTYRPNLNYNGPDSFIYRVSDSQFYDLGTISITVTPVNDPPTSIDMTFTTYEDTSITLSGFVVNDVDSSDSTFTMNITKNVDKGALTVGPTTLDVGSTLPPVYTSWAILYTPPTGLNSGDDTTVFTTFKFRVSDGLLNSVNEYTVKIIVIPVNDPPAGEDIILDTLEDTPIQVTFNPRDVDNAPSTLVITITSVLKGSFFLESTGNTSIKTGTVLPFNGRSMWFFPDADASSTTEPLGVFRYQVSDPDGGLSPEYSGVVWVTPVNDPPVYKGLLDFTTYEDTPIEMNFGVEVLDVDSEGPFTLTVTRTVPVGSLWECTNSDKQCNKVMIVSTPYQLVNKDLLVSFIALPDEFGLRYANFTFTVTDEQGAVSIPYFVNINVIGVNDPPVIVPKFNVLPGRVDMDEDTTLVLEWTVTDIDSPLDTIVSSISVPIPASPGADLFVCPTATDGVCAQPYGDQLVTPMAIPSLSPASYRVVFIPTPDQWDERNYASLTFTAQDDQGADARPVKAIIRVLPINDPPYIQANSTVTITAPSDGALPAFTFREFNLGDPDARKQEIYFTVSIPANAGTLNVTYPRAFEAIGKKPAACVDLSDENTIMINCSDPQTTLNELYFKSVTFQPSDSQMSTVVSVYVDDLGNTDKLKRPLNTSQDVTINYSRDTGLTTESTEPDNTLTIALSVSAGAAVAGVATAIALTRKARMAKVDDFFEKLGDTFDTSNTSPIYQGDQMKQFNSPFYQPKNDNI